LLADEYFRKWIALAGYDGVTNYVHMLKAGHVRYYLRKWRNLNRFSNQGRENYNKLVAQFWHHRKTKGGDRYNRSKTLQIAQWIQRLMLWRTGVAQRFFAELEMQQGDINNDGDTSYDTDSNDDDNNC
jgi:hypothetical protein